MTGAVITFLRCNPFLDARTSLFPSCSFQKQKSDPAFKFFHVMSFYALHVSVEQISHALAQKLEKRFWITLKEMTSAFVVRRLEHLKSRDILCVHRLKTSTASGVQGYKILKEWIQCLCKNIVDRLFIARSKSTNDTTAQTLLLFTNQFALIRDLTVNQECCLASHHEKFWTEQFACLEAQCPPQVCSDETSCS